jgi:membrane-bound lytic murein transglycosylase MltF
MKLAATTILLAIVLTGCSGSSSSGPAPRKATAAAPAKIEIPTAPEQPINKLEKNTKSFTGDLDAISGRGYLRVLVAPSRTYFQTVDGRHQGLAVDAGVALAKRLSEEAKIEITPVFIETRDDQLIPSLLAGKGDVAANLLLTFARDEQVAFATPIRTGIKELIVTDAGKGIVSLEDVGGRTITVRKSSDHYASLIRLNEQLTKINRPPAYIVADEKTRTDEEMLDSVNAGRIKATVVDDYIFDRWEGGLIKIARTNREVAVSQDGSLAWVTRKDAPRLLALMNEFFGSHRLTF